MKKQKEEIKSAADELRVLSSHETEIVLNL